MPRKKSAIPPATRVRENQRRSRARRKELISDLQQRLYEYEQRDIQATALVQLAARRVAWQNVQLRTLLVRKGVSVQEIDEFLLQPYGRPEPMPLSNATRMGLHGDYPILAHERQSVAAVNIGGPTDYISRFMVGTTTDDEQRDTQKEPIVYRKVDANVAVINTYPDLPSSQVNSSVPRKDDYGVMHSPISRPGIPSYSDHSVIPAGPDCSCKEADLSPNSDSEQQEGLLSPVSDCFCPAIPTQVMSGPEKTMLEMSCETAASIIAGMRGNGDVEQARSQLGCDGHQQCNVRSINVLQVMEMD